MPHTFISAVITPDPGTVRFGETLQLTVMGTYTDGVFDITDDVLWDTDNVNVATAALGGIISFVGVGSCTVTAMVNIPIPPFLVPVLSTVNAEYPPIETFEIIPPTITVNTVGRLLARVTYDNDAVQDVTGTAVWSTSDPDVVTVDGGLITAVGPGTAVVSCTHNPTAECVVTSTKVFGSNVEKFVRAIAAACQMLDDTHQQMLVGYDVDTAIGAQLTLLGKRVGRKREGITDNEIFRRYVRAQILANKSNGNIEDIIAIAMLVVYDDDATYRVTDFGRNSFNLRIEDVIVARDVIEILVKFIRKAVSAGYRAVIEFQTAEIADTLTFGGVSPSASGGGKGFGSVVRPGTVGGLFASARDINS